MHNYPSFQRTWLLLIIINSLWGFYITTGSLPWHSVPLGWRAYPSSHNRQRTEPSTVSPSWVHSAQWGMDRLQAGWTERVGWLSYSFQVLSSISEAYTNQTPTLVVLNLEIDSETSVTAGSVAEFHVTNVCHTKLKEAIYLNATFQDVNDAQVN